MKIGLREILIGAALVAFAYWARANSGNGEKWDYLPGYKPGTGVIT